MEDCSTKQEQNERRSVCNFKTRGERRATEGKDRVERCEGNERSERRQEC